MLNAACYCPWLYDFFWESELKGMNHVLYGIRMTGFKTFKGADLKLNKKTKIDESFQLTEEMQKPKPR